MPVRFTRARTATVGQRPTSNDMRSLACAVNDRILSGLGDCAWRISWYLFNLWRQTRNPDSSGYLFPPQGEFFDVYGAIDPEHNDYIHPTAAPGDPEGSNLASPMPALVHGEPDAYSETDALSDLTGYPASTLRDKWELGKIQRGARDVATGAQGWPAGEVAQRFMTITSGTWSPHGKAWGGYLPTPVYKSTGYGGDGYRCGADEDAGLYFFNHERKFTALRADVEVPAGHGGTESTVGGVKVITYAGDCPCSSDASGAGHVSFIWEGPLAYYVYVRTAGGADCSTDAIRFPFVDWIQGPYEGVGRLEHTDGKQLNRVMHAFASDFRGTPDQREPDSFNIQAIAADMQAFMGRQYLLAPARGVLAGEFVYPLYPSAVFSGATFYASGDQAVFSPATGASGFVLSGVFADATGLQSPVSVCIMSGQTTLATLSLTPDADGNAEAMAWLSAPAAIAGAVAVLAGDATFTSTSGSITIECAELAEMKPEHWDAYLLCRLAAGGNAEQVRGRGRDWPNSSQIISSYFESGCAIGTTPAPDDTAINQNALYDVARRMTNQCLRIINRRQFVAYEVADGKSILYLRRFAYGMSNGRVDLLAGIAPPLDPAVSGELVEGETYIVRSPGGSGIIRYRGQDLRDGQTLVASENAVDFEADGDALLYLRDGIRQTALKKGWTNRWCSFVETQCYAVSESSIYKPGALADYFTFSDRCMFRSGFVSDSMLTQSSFNYGVSVDAVDGHMSLDDPWVRASMMAPELPTGYRYADHPAAGTAYDTSEFRQSCRVYEPPVEIESCVVDGWQDDQVVKITFTGRFHSHPSAPATWSRTAPSWASDAAVPAEVTALIDEVSGAGGFRTVDNALREYHVHQSNAHYQCKLAPSGDSGIGSDIMSDPGKPFGSCYPHIHIVSLMREPYDDGNDTVEPHDSRMTVDELQRAELYLRASCEGFVDNRTSVAIICDTGNGGLYSYTYENCCFDGFGGRWIGSVGLPLRSENPEGFGPLPNTRIYGDVFNRLASCWNLLDKCHLEIPMQLEVRERGNYGLNTNYPYSAFGPGYLAFGKPIPLGPEDYDTGWAVGTEVNASCTAAGAAISGSDLVVGSDWVTQEYRLAPESATSYECVPPAIQSLVAEANTGFIAVDASYENPVTFVGVNTESASHDCFGSKLWNGSRGLAQAPWNYAAPCVLANCGIADPRPAGGVRDFGFMSASPSETCGFGVANRIQLLPVDLTIGTFVQVPLIDL